MCGLHVFVCYAMALASILAMSAACLAATRSGFFEFAQEVEPLLTEESGNIADVVIDYELDNSDCFGLGETQTLDPLDASWAAGNSMTADTGLAVALGHAVAAVVALTHMAFFVLLYSNIDPVPVRGYLYMRGLGLMSALASFYLLFTCVVSFFFGVKGSLDLHMRSSKGLTPSWAYVLTVVNVTVMMMVAMRACQDDEVDSAIATPQYTSSSRDEDTVKRASGKLLHLRSRSSDTILEGPMTNALAVPAPKATVTASDAGASGDGSSAPSASGGAHPPATGAGAVGQGSTLRMSAAASSAAAHAASAIGSMAAAAAAAAAAATASPVPSSSVMSSWTGRVSGISPARRRAGSGDMEEGGTVHAGSADGDRGELDEELCESGAVREDHGEGRLACRGSRSESDSRLYRASDVECGRRSEGDLNVAAVASAAAAAAAAAGIEGSYANAGTPRVSTPRASRNSSVAGMTHAEADEEASAPGATGSAVTDAAAEATSRPAESDREEAVESNSRRVLAAETLADFSTARTTFSVAFDGASDSLDQSDTDADPRHSRSRRTSPTSWTSDGLSREDAAA